MNTFLTITLGLAITTTSVIADSLIKKAKEAGLESIPSSHVALMSMINDPHNTLTPAKVELGKMLYFDPRLSKSGLISCNTCHNLATGGVDGVSAAIGHNWAANPHHLNSPTVYNSVFNKTQFWDGRSPHLEDQAKGPMQAIPEMAIDPRVVVERLKSIPTYEKLFQKAFPKEKESLTFDTIAKAYSCI